MVIENISKDIKKKKVVKIFNKLNFVENKKVIVNSQKSDFIPFEAYIQQKLSRNKV